MADPLSYRSFDSRVTEIATAWRNLAVTKDNWVSDGTTFGSQAVAFGVTNGALRAVAKPGRKIADGISYAAHEKIASDLAFELGLPLPPVVLWRRPDANWESERFCALSAWAFRGARKLDEISPERLPPNLHQSAQCALSALVAFDTWIAVEDRHGGNLLIDGNFECDQPVAAIDYC